LSLNTIKAFKEDLNAKLFAIYSIKVIKMKEERLFKLKTSLPSFLLLLSFHEKVELQKAPILVE